MGSLSNKFKKLAFWFKDTKKLKTYTIKGVLITSACVVGLIAPLTLPIFAIISLWTKSPSYMMNAFILLDLKSVVTFILDS
jgi:hypothetical protein